MKYPSSSIFNRDFLLKINVRNTFEIPQLSHISINLTSRSLVAEKKHSLFPLVGLSLLSGQQPKVLRAKKSVAAFKLKKNAIIGCQLTLRKEKMPSVLQLGFTEFLFFPELEKNFELFETMQGCSIQLHTTAKADFEKRLIWTSYNFPVYSKTV